MGAAKVIVFLAGVLLSSDVKKQTNKQEKAEQSFLIHSLSGLTFSLHTVSVVVTCKCCIRTSDLLKKKMAVT